MLREREGEDVVTNRRWETQCGRSFSGVLTPKFPWVPTEVEGRRKRR